MNDNHFIKLLNLLKEIPGITKKQAEKIIYYILGSYPDYAKELSEAIVEFKNTHKKCKLCNNFDKNDICSVCQQRSNSKRLMVVEKASDIKKFEDLNFFKGKYFVIEHLVNPAKNITLDQKIIDQFLETLDTVSEITLALPTNLEGQVTMQYLKSLVKNKDTSVYQLSTGIPIGASVDYIDPLTLKESLENKKQM